MLRDILEDLAASRVGIAIDEVVEARELLVGTHQWASLVTLVGIHDADEVFSCCQAPNVFSDACAK